jgi:hypothetical protein
MEDGLSFPSKKLEVEFRDGVRLVPDYLASIMSRLETHTMTYEEAIDAANRQMEADHLNNAGADFIAAHFRGHQ